MLIVKNVSKTYKGNVKACDNVSIEINAGDIFGFIGHNGAGKTTLIKCITGIHDFDEGEITLERVSVKDDPITVKRNFAYIPDKPDLYDNLTGIQYLNFIADIFGVDKVERGNKIAVYASEFDITNRLGDKISSYSHGMKQKIAIVSALLHSPRLIIMDEPFSGLDPKAAFTLKKIMRERTTKEGVAIFFSTHVLEVAEKLCNKVAIIKEGKIIIKGNIEEVLQDNSLESVFLELVDKVE